MNMTVSDDHLHMHIYEQFVKRGFDILLSALGLVAFGWLYVLTALAIYMDDPGPVIFLQKRIGKDKTTFIAGKFGTVGVNKKRCLECA